MHIGFVSSENLPIVAPLLGATLNKYDNPSFKPVTSAGECSISFYKNKNFVNKKICYKKSHLY